MPAKGSKKISTKNINQWIYSLNDENNDDDELEDEYLYDDDNDNEEEKESNNNNDNKGYKFPFYNLIDPKINKSKASTKAKNKVYESQQKQYNDIENRDNNNNIKGQQRHFINNVLGQELYYGKI